MLRFKTNCFKQKFKRNVDGLTAEEVNTRRRSYLCLIRLSQREMFPNEYSALHRGISVCKGHVMALNPFLDDKDIIRVGGRLANADFEYDKKYPILLSSKHYLTKLIFQREHLRLYHAGPQLLLASVREKFWPLAGRNLAKHTRNLAKHTLIKQHFWKRWNKEYVSELQQRIRWNKNSGSSLQEGHLVLIKDENLPPMKWKLGRVLSLHYGNDNVANLRVATIKTVSGNIKRALMKLCPLPIDYE
ncbi:methyltransferase (DUF5641) [Popillia japonica]|uniref:Methyltransferase (DUF5641) n=1 Tax=Popillia japonica TaxID=7064 RepID=A0AAW1JIX2_POPJA